jgi:hypothetical protein
MRKITKWIHVMSGFHRQVDENCNPLGCYVVRSGNSLPLLAMYTCHAVVQKRQFYTMDKGKAVPLQAWSSPEGSRKFDACVSVHHI